MHCQMKKTVRINQKWKLYSIQPEFKKFVVIHMDLGFTASFLLLFGF